MVRSGGFGCFCWYCMVIDTRSHQLARTEGFNRKIHQEPDYNSAPALNSPHRMTALAPIDATGSGGSRLG